MYEERIVAFIDILGFRAMINDTMDGEIVNQEKLNILVEVLDLIKTEFKKKIGNNELPYSFMINYFSDSIIFSLMRFNALSLLDVFRILKRIQIKLVGYQILLRGGVVVGKLLHTSNIILGPALNEAYDLERKSALYPRIVIDPDIMELDATDDEYNDNLYSLREFTSGKTFESDFDNTYYINYFSDVKEYLDDGDEAKYYSGLNILIQNGLKRKEIGIRVKYMWMLRKFNSEKPSNVQV